MEELKKAPVTVLLILANILVFTAVEFTGGSEDTMHMHGILYAGRIL